MKNPRVLAAVFTALVVGLISGLVLGRSQRETRDPSPSKKEERKAEAPTADPMMDSPRIIREQKEEIARLEERVRSLQAGREPSREDKIATAKEIYESFVKLANRDREPDPEEFVKVLGRLDEVDSDMAAYFISRLEEAIESGEREKAEEMGIFLILCSGGPDVTAFLNRHLRGEAGTPESRRELLQAVSGSGGPPFSMSKIPIDERLQELAYGFLESSDPNERAGGAGLLSGQHDDQGPKPLETSLGIGHPPSSARRLAPGAGPHRRSEHVELLGVPGQPVQRRERPSVSPGSRRRRRPS